MHPMRFACAAVLVLSAFVGACSDSSNPAGPSSAKPNTPPVSTTECYFPLTHGSWWKYSGIRTYTTSVGNDTVINGLTYATTYNTGAVGTGLARWNGTSLYAAPATDPTHELLVLKQDGIVGTKWSFEFSSPNGTLNHYECETTEIGLTRTVQGKSYTAVMHVVLKDYVSFTGIPPTLMDQADYYFAKGVGMIEFDDMMSGSIELVDHHIAP